MRRNESAAVPRTLQVLTNRHSCRTFSRAPSAEVGRAVSRSIAEACGRGGVPRSLYSFVDLRHGATAIPLGRDGKWAVPETVGMVTGPKHWAAVVQRPDGGAPAALAAGVAIEQATLAINRTPGLKSVTIADPRLAKAFPELSDHPLVRRGATVRAFICYGVPDAAAYARDNTPPCPRDPWQTLFYYEKYAPGCGLQRSSLPRVVPDPRYLHCLDAVRCGQSAFNSQPWRVVVARSSSSLPRPPAPRTKSFVSALLPRRLRPARPVPPPSREPPLAFHFFFRTPTSRVPKELNPASWWGLDMGIALCNWSLVAQEAGLRGRWVALGNDAVKSLVPSAPAGSSPSAATSKNNQAGREAPLRYVASWCPDTK